MFEQLREEIQFNMYEIHDLSKAIKNLKDLVDKEPDNKNHYELFEDIKERYNKLLTKTKIQLEAYIAEETKAGLPADMVFRKLYKKIKKAT